MNLDSRGIMSRIGSIVGAYLSTEMHEALQNCCWLVHSRNRLWRHILDCGGGYSRTGDDRICSFKLLKHLERRLRISMVQELEGARTVSENRHRHNRLALAGCSSNQTSLPGRLKVSRFWDTANTMGSGEPHTYTTQMRHEVLMDHRYTDFRRWKKVPVVLQVSILGWNLVHFLHGNAASQNIDP